jgi:hypothetical protein
VQPAPFPQSFTLKAVKDGTGIKVGELRVSAAPYGGAPYRKLALAIFSFWDWQSRQSAV